MGTHITGGRKTVDVSWDEAKNGQDAVAHPSPLACTSHVDSHSLNRLNAAKARCGAISRNVDHRVSGCLIRGRGVLTFERPLYYFATASRNTLYLYFL